MLGSEEQTFEKRLALRMAVIDTAREMNRRGINVNKSGNVSARTSGGRSFFIIPDGIFPMNRLSLTDIVEVSLDAERFEGRCLPSSEWEMHAEIYRRRPDAGAVVHTHSCYGNCVGLSESSDTSIPLYGGCCPEVAQSMWLRMPLLALAN